MGYLFREEKTGDWFPDLLKSLTCHPLTLRHSESWQKHHLCRQPWSGHLAWRVQQGFNFSSLAPGLGPHCYLEFPAIC